MNIVRQCLFGRGIWQTVQWIDADKADHDTALIIVRRLVDGKFMGVAERWNVIERWTKAKTGDNGYLEAVA